MNRLPPGWILASLGEVAKYINGRAFKPYEWKASGAPIVRIQNLTNSSGSFNYTDQQHEEKFRLKNGDLLIAWSASLGAFIWNGGDAWLNQHIFRVEPFEHVITKEFLYYAVTVAIGDLYDKAHGTGMVHITKPVFESHPIPIPPLSEQQRIVAKLQKLLSRVEAAHERLLIIPRILKRFRQSVLAAACTGSLTADWRTENLASSSWAVYSLSKLGTISGGVTKNTKRAQLTLKRPYLRVANVYENRLVLDDVFEIGVTEQEFTRTKLLKDDVLFVEGNGSLEQIGRVALWDASIEDCLHQNHLIKFRADETVLPKYVLLQMMSPGGRAQLVEKATSSAGLNTLSISKISDICLPVPGIKEQYEIVRRVEALFKTADEIEAGYLKAKAHIDKLTPSILAKAFRGELVPQDPNDEPASVLLERIKSESNGAPQ